jgi:hypothetical protein
LPACPQCTKSLAELSRECPYCKANLDLLVEYVNQLQDGLDRAQRCTRAGELSQAVWAYLAVLEVDPDNAAARRQVDQVATAVRQFDRSAPGRRWLAHVRGEEEAGRAERLGHWIRLALGAGFLVVAFLLGFVLGRQEWNTGPSTPSPPRIDRPEPARLGGGP